MAATPDVTAAVNGVIEQWRQAYQVKSEDALARFEKEVTKCHEVVACHLMSGSDDYLVQVQARDMADYERIHKQHLSRMPGVARLHSSFAMRAVVQRSVSPAVLNG